MDSDILMAVDLLRKAQFAVALTGAGLSTPSGIPDFRSPHSGLWENVNPLMVASMFGFKTNPQAFYDWIRPLTATVLAAQPNAAHNALSRIEQMGLLKSVITQNIDLLHSRAGSQNVIEVHGHLREMTCISCYQIMDSAPFIENFLSTGIVPRCPQCGGVLKPNVILFGEQLPIRELNAARQVAGRCDVMLVAGSSLEVAPAGDLPAQAHRHGASIILVNLEQTPIDALAKVVIRGDVATVLPQIADALEAETGKSGNLL
jgi:NAD-dependent deacetylase